MGADELALGFAAGALAGLAVRALAGWAGRFGHGALVPLVGWVAVAAVAAAVVAARHPDLRAVVLVWMVVALTLLSAVDLSTHRLPNRMLYPLAGAGAVLVVAVALARRQPLELAWAAAGLALGFAPFYAVWFVAPAGAIGFGDVRLMGLVGMHLGVVSPLLVLLAGIVGALAGLVAGLVGMVRAGRSHREPFPFGPWLAVGAAVAAAVGTP